MHKLILPDVNSNDLYELCAGRRKNKDLRTRLSSAAATVEAATAQYEALAGTMELYRFSAPALPATAATGAEIAKLYDDVLVPRSSKARWAYDEIMLSAKYGRCPYCGHFPVATLDHYLPKKSHPLLAITVSNLLPSCGRCNYAKLDESPAEEGTQTLHPYFDDFDDATWLSATVILGAGVSLSYQVADVQEWPPIKIERVRHHFEIFQLGKLYATQAAEELSLIKHRLEKLFDQGGIAAIQAHLGEEAETRERAARNSWQTAMYRAIAESGDFISRGFEHIGT